MRERLAEILSLVEGGSPVDHLERADALIREVAHAERERLLAEFVAAKTRAKPVREG